MKFRDLTKRKLKKHSIIAVGVAVAAAAVVVGVSVPGSRGNSQAGTLPKVTKTPPKSKLPKKPVSHGITWSPSNKIAGDGGFAVVSWHVTGAKSCDMVATKDPYKEHVTYPTKWVNCSGGYYKEGIKFGPNPSTTHNNVITWLLTASTAPVPVSQKGIKTAMATTGYGPPVALADTCTGAHFTSPCPPLV